jgi:hypothetical protein
MGMSGRQMDRRVAVGIRPGPADWLTGSDSFSSIGVGGPQEEQKQAEKRRGQAEYSVISPIGDDRASGAIRTVSWHVGQRGCIEQHSVFDVQYVSVSVHSFSLIHLCMIVRRVYGNQA